MGSTYRHGKVRSSVLVQRSLVAFLTGAQRHRLDPGRPILEFFGWPVTGVQPLLGSPGQFLKVAVEKAGCEVTSDTPSKAHRPVEACAVDGSGQRLLVVYHFDSNEFDVDSLSRRSMVLAVR